jgi:hypothetical protein
MIIPSMVSTMIRGSEQAAAVTNNIHSSRGPVALRRLDRNLIGRRHDGK